MYTHKPPLTICATFCIEHNFCLINVGQNVRGGRKGEAVTDEIKVDIDNEVVDDATIHEEPIPHNSTS